MQSDNQSCGYKDCYKHCAHKEFNNLDDARKHARQLRDYYKGVVMYCIINGAFVLAWLMGDGGSFWPIWPIVIWGGLLLIGGSKLGVTGCHWGCYCSWIQDQFPFMQDKWVDKKAIELLKAPKTMGMQTKTLAEKKVADVASKVKKSAPAKQLVKKATAVKKAVKKAAPKKATVKKAEPAKKPVKKVAPKKKK